VLVAQIVFDRFTDLDVFLAWDLLNRVQHPGFQVKLLGTRSHHTSRSGLTVPMHGSIDEAAQADAVLFASGPATRDLRSDREFLGRLRLDPERQLIGSMCSGALLLAALGLLDGKRATTHPTTVEHLRQAGVDVVDEPFVCVGNVATAAACLAGVDLAGWVIERLLGRSVLDAVMSEVRPVERAYAPSANAQQKGDARYEGSCLCGSVRYEISGELGDFGHCHCKSCQKASGSAYAANAPVERARFHVAKGKDRIREYESSRGKFRAFCTSCGSPLYAYLTISRDVLRIRLGSLDTPFTKQGKAHTFVSEKAPWEAIADGAPHFPEWAPKSVLHQRGSRQDQQ
jgi:putative intracellular protease/amidase